MKVRVKKEFELHSNHMAREDDVFNLITINTEDDEFFIIIEKFGHIFEVYFKSEFSANEHLEFNYEEKELANTETFIAESEVKKMIEEAREEGFKEAEYWKDKCMKLIDKI